MFCTKCGKQNLAEAVFCGSCGINLTAGSEDNTSIAHVRNEAKAQMSFGQSISTCFSKYAKFGGRATRAEYWWFYLFALLLSWGSILVDPTQMTSMIINLALFLPILSAGTRRLHDTNRSGWWQLIVFTLIGVIPLIIWLASASKDQDNKYSSEH